jgi:hypothetical protein
MTINRLKNTSLKYRKVPPSRRGAKRSPDFTSGAMSNGAIYRTLLNYFNLGESDMGDSGKKDKGKKENQKKALLNPKEKRKLKKEKKNK